MKIVIGGQIDKKEIAEDVAKLWPEAEVEVQSDLDAAMAMKAGRYDYYIGACNTGGGGALAMALALLGKEQCATLSMPGKLPEAQHVKEEVEKGKVAFGFTAQHRDQVLPTLIACLKQRGENK